MITTRYIAQQIQKDISRKMVFVGGPRQVGKTTLIKQLLAEWGATAGYLNWDIATHREYILRRELPNSNIWAFDELHKYRLWRNYLKGLFDEVGDKTKILVTGSARLDYYRFSGDSLQGRYHYLRLHPLSVAELAITSHDDFTQLVSLGGFPEPFFSGSEVEARRWSREYRTRLIKDEITSLEAIKDLGILELLILRLPELVGSPLSIEALREDLKVNYRTVARWLDIIERMYGIFRLAPFGAPKLRAVKKEQKHYHFDWTLIKNPGQRFENVVASHLLKWVHFREDTEGLDLELRFYRDTAGREVDFVITEDRKPTLLIECKLSDYQLSPHLRYLAERLPGVRAVQVVGSPGREYRTPEGIEVLNATTFLRELV